MDTLLDLHQAEILEDLNSLGRYSRSVLSSQEFDNHPLHCQGRYLYIFIVYLLQEKRDEGCIARLEWSFDVTWGGRW